MHKLTKLLFENSDATYKIFSEKLIPDTNLSIIGVRVPIIKNIEKNAENDCKNDFINIKHEYLEEFMLHGIILGNLKSDVDVVLSLVDKFIPQIDNWAVCDSTVSSLKIFKKNTDKVFYYVKKWLNSDKPYVIRFAIVTLLTYFLGENFNAKILDLVKNIYCDHYYVNMAFAWLYSVALVKNYDQTIKVIQEKSLPKFVQNKSIQKALESYRISDDKKKYLRTLKK